MAQLGDFVQSLSKSRARLRPKEPVAWARCIVAEAEIALVSRDLSFSARRSVRLGRRSSGMATGRTPRTRGISRFGGCCLIGRLDEAERALAKFDAAPLPPALRASHELAVAEVAMRRLQIKTARAALAEAERAAHDAGIPALMAEVEGAALILNTPAARLIAPGEERLILLEEVEALLASGTLVVDACRHVVRNAGHRGLAHDAPGIVRTGARAGRSLARGRLEEHAPRQSLPREARG